MLGARIARSCSAWMVATIECIERSRARDSWASSAPSPTIGSARSSGLGVEQVVLDTEDVHALAAQDPAAYDALRVGLRRLVEDRCRGGAPVDQQHVVVVVAQPDAADVARDPADLRAHVEAAEDQALVGGVEGRHPAGGLEDHRVALDETALVADAAAGEPLLRQLLGRQTDAFSSWRRRCRRTPARSRSRARPRHCSTPGVLRSGNDQSEELILLVPGTAVCAANLGDPGSHDSGASPSRGPVRRCARNAQRRSAGPQARAAAPRSWLAWKYTEPALAGAERVAGCVPPVPATISTHAAGRGEVTQPRPSAVNRS